MAKMIDMTDQTFNGCKVIKREGSDKDRKATWLCQCFCGKSFITTGKSIRLGFTKSCGCHKKNIIMNAGMNNKTHGMTKTRLYRIWRGIKKRCRYEKDASYKYYGSKGIDVCDEWFDSFDNFKDWALSNGYNDSLTIDRIDNSKGYYPENCKWSTYKEQARNRSNNVKMNFRNESLTKSEVAEKLGISRNLLQYRLNKGLMK